jgi:ABC-type antimicrobial peptide transport system permease subunit
LGLLLGTVGLGVILIRNVVERRAELAALRAFGYQRSTLGWLVVLENAFLLVVGLLIGILSAIFAVTPALTGHGAEIPWFSLLATLLLVLAVGMLACLVAVRFALRIPMLPALRAE